MEPPPTNTRLAALLTLGQALGREDRKLAILGEGNVSARSGDGFIIKASGRSLATFTEDGIVSCRREKLIALMSASSPTDELVDQTLMDSRVDPSAPKPSVEAVFHAYLLGLPGIEWVGHTHPVSVNRILCSPRAQEFASRRMFPDEIVCCGEESVFVRYTDPGLALAIAIRREVEAFESRRGTLPRVILLGSHGVITMGATDGAVLGAMLMVQKSAEIWLGAAMLGGPVFLEAGDVARIAGRSDEHYRQRALNL